MSGTDHDWSKQIKNPWRNCEVLIFSKVLGLQPSTLLLAYNFIENNFLIGIVLAFFVEQMKKSEVHKQSFALNNQFTSHMVHYLSLYPVLLTIKIK